MEIKDLILNKVKIPDKIIENNNVIDYLVNNFSVTEYRILINLLEYRQSKYQIDKIENKRNKYYENLFYSFNFKSKMLLKYENIYNYFVKLINDEKLIDTYKLINYEFFKNLNDTLKHDILVILYNLKKDKKTKIDELNELFKNTSIREYLECFIDYKFRDIPYNFILNVEQVIKYNNDCFYSKLYESYKNNYINVNYYEFYKNKDLITDFYDIYRSSKDKSYDFINNSLYEFNDRQYSFDLSKKYGCDIYDFNGNTFYLLIHNTGVNKDSKLDDVFSGSAYDSTSLSLVSNNRLKYYNDFSKSIILGFNNIDKNNIVHVYESDSYSSFLKKDEEDLATNRVNKIYKPQDLVTDTRGYNEIIYQCHSNINENNLSNELVPSYVLVFNKLISDLDIKVAKKYNIPIININKDMYTNLYKRTVIDILKDDDSYITDIESAKKLIK